MRRLIYGLLATILAVASAPVIWYAKAGVSCSLPFNLQNNTTADATQVMANYNAIVTCLGNAAAAGANSDITSLLGLTTPIPRAAGGTQQYWGGTSGGSANAQTLAAPAPIGFTLTAGNTVFFLPGNSNTGATTLNVNSTGVTAMRVSGPAGLAALVGGELVSGAMASATYDGTFYVLNDMANLTGGFGNCTSLASGSPTAGTVDFSTAKSHCAAITGTTTLTSFGTPTASVLPFWRFSFAGALTLTHNATTLILPGAANITTAANDRGVAEYLGSGNWRVIDYTPASGYGILRPTPTFTAIVTGTALTFTVQSTPTTPLYLRVRMCGGGGGGGGAGAGNGSGGNGGATSFGSWTANGGAQGTGSGTGSGGAGGTAGTDSTGTILRRLSGQNGGSSIGVNTGGTSVYGGAGVGFSTNTSNGNAAKTASCAGASGGITAGAAGGGGGGGEFAEFIITSLATSYTYTIGAFGTTGAGANTGGAGATGRLEVEQYWQ